MRGDCLVSLRLVLEMWKQLEMGHIAMGRNCHGKVESHCWSDAQRNRKQRGRSRPMPSPLGTEPELESWPQRTGLQSPGPSITE